MLGLSLPIAIGVPVKHRAAFLAGVLLLVTAAGASAQRLDSGRWTGTVVVPEAPGVVMPVAVDVRGAGDSLALTLFYEQMPGIPIRLNAVKLSADRLTFSFTPPGAVVNCALARQENGSWAGDCVDGNGATARLTMNPPKREGADPLA